MDNDIEIKIIEEITRKKAYSHSFEEIVKEFDRKFSNLNLAKDSFKIEKYFNGGAGIATARNNLLSDGLIQNEWLREYKTPNGKSKTDFKGIYIFINNDRPFYIGISKGVIGRIHQHVKGHSHNNSTLAYNISLIRHKIINGYEYKGSRDGLDFKTEVEPVKEFLSKQKVFWAHIENDEELYLFEIYCAMRLQTVLNKFETH